MVCTEVTVVLIVSTVPDAGLRIAVEPFAIHRYLFNGLPGCVLRTPATNMEASALTLVIADPLGVMIVTGLWIAVVIDEVATSKQKRCQYQTSHAEFARFQ